jgi:hypothetical protein
LFIATVLSIFVGNAYHLFSIGIPYGHDAEFHMEHALVLAGILQHQPGDALSFLQSLPVRYPPLTFLLMAAMWLVTPSAAAFLATNLALGVAAVVFFYLAALAATKDRLLSQVFVLALLANPVWFKIAVSGNLEMGLVAATGLACWLLLDPRFEKTATRSLFSGAVLGLCLLTKAVAFVVVAPMLAVHVLLACGADERLRPLLARRLWRLLGCSVVAAVWYLPQLRKFGGEFAVDLRGFTPEKAPLWWYYLKTVSFGFNLAPFAVGLALALRQPARRSFSPANLAPFFAGLLGLAFYSLIGTKRDWYIFPAVAMLLISALPTAPDAFRPRGRVAVRMLFFYYAVAATLLWTPPGGPLFRVLAPATDPPTWGLADRPGDEEAAATAHILAATRRFGLGTLEIVAPRELISPKQVWTTLEVADARFAYLRSWAEPAPTDRIEAMMADAQYYVVVQRRVAGVAEAVKTPYYDVHAVLRHAVFLENRAHFALIDRFPYNDDYEFQMYRNTERAVAWEADANFAALLDIYESRHHYGNQRYLQRARRACFAGRREEAEPRYRSFFRHHQPFEAAFVSYLSCLADFDDRLAETADLSWLLRRPDLSDSETDRTLSRLFALATQGAPRETIDGIIRSFIAESPAGGATRLAATRWYFAFLLDGGAATDAEKLTLAESEYWPPETRAATLVRFGEQAELRGERPLAATLFRAALAGASAGGADALIAEAHLAAALPATDGAAAFPAAGAIPQRDAALSMTQSLLQRSARLRQAGDAAQAEKLVRDHLASSDGCRECRDLTLLELARALIASGKSAEAKTTLQRLRSDTADQEIADIARLLASKVP